MCSYALNVYQFLACHILSFMTCSLEFMKSFIIIIFVSVFPIFCSKPFFYLLYTHNYTYAHTWTCTHACTHTHLCTHIHAHTNTQWAHTFLCMCMDACLVLYTMSLCILQFVHICMHATFLHHYVYKNLCFAI